MARWRSTVTTFFMHGSGQPNVFGSGRPNAAEQEMGARQPEDGVRRAEAAWQAAAVQHAFNQQLSQGGRQAQEAFVLFVQCKLEAERQFRCEERVAAHIFAFAVADPE